MKALILASGTGSRLKPLTDRNPKCLIPLKSGRNILELQILALDRAGIKDIIITTGPFEDQMVEFIEKCNPELDIKLVRNEIYEDTNYIYSMYKAEKYLNNEDILLMHGDLVFDDTVLTKLLDSCYENCVLIKRDHHPQKDFKAEIRDDGRVIKIAVDLTGTSSHFLAPFYKFSHKSMVSWFENIRRFVENDQKNCYAENALNELLESRIDLRAVYFNDELCVEIDDFEDLQWVNRLAGI